jgi:Winged helix DNA-binding domain
MEDVVRPELVEGRLRWASTSSARIRRDVLRRRLATQRLTNNGLSRATEVVRLLGCVQSQEYAHGLWSLGMRTSGLRLAEVQAEFDTGSFLRTHILRPTWHFVAAEDIRWILQATAPRVQKLNQTIYRQHGLDPASLDRGLAIVSEELKGGRYRTRSELARALADHQLASQGIGLAYIIMNAELEGVICSGPLRGAQQTYALLDERVPRSMETNGDITELARRFFLGHGPASIQDFARWSSLAISQSRDALDAIKDQLSCVVVEGVELWFEPASDCFARQGSLRADPALSPPTSSSLAEERTPPLAPPQLGGARSGGTPLSPLPGALLIPLYDELTLSYPVINFPLVTGHPHLPGEDLFVGCVIIAETNIGLWRRTMQSRKMIMEITVAPGMLPGSRDLLEAAAVELATFVGKQLELTITG